MKDGDERAFGANLKLLPVGYSLILDGLACDCVSIEHNAIRHHRNLVNGGGGPSLSALTWSRLPFDMTKGTKAPLMQPLGFVLTRPSSLVCIVHTAQGRDCNAEVTDTLKSFESSFDPPFGVKSETSDARNQP